MARDIDKYSRIKIFVGYYKPNYLFSSEVYQPILTSDVDWDNPKIIKDNTGINIAEKHAHYAELTGHYWVWKNFLPKTKSEYIGFCHYRRFLDFNFTKTELIPFKPINGNDFRNTFKMYSPSNIMRVIDGYDIILPYAYPLDCNTCAQYLRYHPKEDLNLTIKTISELYPEYIEACHEFLSSYEFYSCLQFIMKKELVNEYMEWIFNVLEAVEKAADWNKYTEYLNVRTPAFLAERLLNIWLLHNIKHKNLKVLNTTSLILTGEGYISSDFDNPKVCDLRYLIKVEQLKQKTVTQAKV